MEVIRGMSKDTPLSPKAHKDTISSINCGPIIGYGGDAIHEACAGWIPSPVEEFLECGCWCHIRRRALIQQVISETLFDRTYYLPDDTIEPVSPVPEGDEGKKLQESLAKLGYSGITDGEYLNKLAKLGYSPIDPPPLDQDDDDPSEIVHACPPGDKLLTPCCGQSPHELPFSDRMTLDPALVTCGGKPESPVFEDFKTEDFKIADDDPIFEWSPETGARWNREEQRYEDE